MELKRKLNVVPILQWPSDHERRNPILGPHIRIGKGLGTFLTLGRNVLTLHPHRSFCDLICSQR